MGIELVEGHAMPDHVPLCLSIPPKYSVANTVGWLKGKSAIRIHREFLGRERNFTGLHFLPFYQFTQPSVSVSPCSVNSLDFFESFSVRLLRGQGPQNATYGDAQNALWADS